MATAIDSVSAVDADTVDITLSAPDPAMEYYLSQALGLMGSPASLGTDAMDRLPVGTGPYTMVADKSVVGSQYVFVARDGYWNPDLQKWDKIDLKLLPDVTARVNALVTGEVDATILDGTTYQQAECAGKSLLEYATDWQGLLLFDRDGTLNPALKDVRVRQAINYAFDRENLLAQLGGGKGKVTSQVFGPDSTAYVPELDTYYTYDPGKAKQLLADAGYANGLTIEMPMATPGTETIMTFVAQQLADVGITREADPGPDRGLPGRARQGEVPGRMVLAVPGPAPGSPISRSCPTPRCTTRSRPPSSEIEGSSPPSLTTATTSRHAQALNKLRHRERLVRPVVPARASCTTTTRQGRRDAADPDGRAVDLQLRAGLLSQRPGAGSTAPAATPSPASQRSRPCSP